MDDADRAQRLEEAEREAAIARATAPAGPGSVTSMSCGVPIPPQRRRALPGACLCITCQEEFERSVRR